MYTIYLLHICIVCTIAYIYAIFNFRAPEYIRHTFIALQRETDSNKIIDFNTPVPTIDKWFRQKICKTTVDLNNSIDQKDLRKIDRLFHITTA